MAGFSSKICDVVFVVADRGWEAVAIAWSSVWRVAEVCYYMPKIRKQRL